MLSPTSNPLATSSRTHLVQTGGHGTAAAAAAVYRWSTDETPRSPSLAVYSTSVHRDVSLSSSPPHRSQHFDWKMKTHSFRQSYPDIVFNCTAIVVLGVFLGITFTQATINSFCSTPAVLYCTRLDRINKGVNGQNTSKFIPAVAWLSSPLLMFTLAFQYSRRLRMASR